MRRRRGTKLVFVATSIWLIVGCAQIFGINSADVDGGADGSSPDGAADAPQDAFDGGFVNPDANYADCGAGSRTIGGDAGFFVAATGGGSACTIASPCASIANAINAAITAGGGTIFIAPGTYTESINLQQTAAPLTFQGGWQITDAGWVSQCTPSAATIQANGTPATVQIGATTQPTSFSLLKIVNGPVSVAAGQSLYGFLVQSAAPVTLENVEIFVADAGAGTDGTGFVFSMDGGFPNCSIPGDGSNGGAGGNGTGGQIVAQANGFGETAPTGGGAGHPGASGTAGTDGGCANCANSCNMSSQGACDAGTSPTCVAITNYVCGTNGQFGCGGAGGAGGAPGSNGGSSVGIYIYQGNLTVTNGAIAVGAGGKGGNGAAGDAGGVGSPGSAGSSATCTNYSCAGTCGDGGFMYPQCSQSVMSSYMLSGGAAGGDGGNGGPGGQGGGGAGGYSYAIYAIGNASVTRSNVAISVSQPALGGAAGGPSGQSGQTNGDF